jgi:hypothetical protein
MRSLVPLPLARTISPAFYFARKESGRMTAAVQVLWEGEGKRWRARRMANLNQENRVRGTLTLDAIERKLEVAAARRNEVRRRSIPR